MSTSEEAPLVSCVVPAYNAERFLGEALDSILRQDYRPIEVIVVDDGSTDSTPAVIARYSSDHPDGVRGFHQTNAGPAAALNRGLSEAHGDFVSFLAADDLWHPDKLRLQMEQFNDDEDLQVCVTHIQNFWGPELEEEARRYKDHRIAQPMPGYLAVTMLARRSVFEEVGPFNASLQHGNDIDWFMRARQKKVKTSLLTPVLVKRRLHETNRSRHLASNSRDTILDILKASIDRGREQQ